MTQQDNKGESDKLNLESTDSGEGVKALKRTPSTALSLMLFFIVALCAVNIVLCVLLYNYQDTWNVGVDDIRSDIANAEDRILNELALRAKIYNQDMDKTIKNTQLLVAARALNHLKRELVIGKLSNVNIDILEKMETTLANDNIAALLGFIKENNNKIKSDKFLLEYINNKFYSPTILPSPAKENEENIKNDENFIMKLLYVIRDKISSLVKVSDARRNMEYSKEARQLELLIVYIEAKEYGKAAAILEAMEVLKERYASELYDWLLVKYTISDYIDFLIDDILQ
jgi:hypothetical protein